MSRCFPFPPPGYEKKPRSDDADLLKKEKHKEKKKKDKKDKEKKEVKEKREKKRSDGKNREKKDRKEKHGEKKKDKEDRDREKVKDKSSISEEKRVGEQVEGYNGEKSHPREVLDKEKKISSSDEKKATFQFSSQQGEKPVQSSIPVKEAEDPKFIQELGRRIREIEKGAGSSQFVDRFSVLEQKKDDLAGRSAVGDIKMVSKGKNKDKKADAKKMDGQRIRDEARFTENMVVENCAEIIQNKIEGPTIPSDKRTERKIEETNKSRVEENNDKRGEKRKKKDKDKKSHGEEEKKREEKAKEKSGHKKAEKDKTKHSSNIDIVCAPSDKSTHLPNNGAGTSANEENFKKRKTAETNGFSHEDEPWPKKMPRQASSSNISTQNGRKLDPTNQSHVLFPLDRQKQNQVAMASPNNFKEQKINGIISSPPLSLPKPKPSSSSSSTVISVSTSKPLSKTANELSAVVGPVSTAKPLSETANEIATSLTVSSVKPPSATSVMSISAAKQPSPPDIGVAQRASASSKKPLSINNQVVKPSSSMKPPHPDSPKKPSSNNNQVVKPSSSMKPPHPDSKFLNQILTVPRIDDVSDLDDQEWLFRGKDRLLKKRNMDSDGIDEEEAPQVWAEALRLESVDIFALPYVVPC